METEGVIDPDWRELSTVQRDIIVTLAVIGGATGAEIHRQRGGAADTEPTTHRNLSSLRERDFVHSERVDGDDRARENRLTDKGVTLFTNGVVSPAVDTGAVRLL